MGLAQLSDPGPRFKESMLYNTQDEHEDPSSPEPDVGSQSMATENSDEEPLEGDSRDHIEAMLRRVLVDDERNAPGDGSGDDDSEEGDYYGSDSDPVDDSEHEKAEGSDAEDLEEAAALKLHLLTLREGIHEFDIWARTCMLEVESAGSPASLSSRSSRASPIGPPSTRAERVAEAVSAGTVETADAAHGRSSSRTTVCPTSGPTPHRPATLTLASKLRKELSDLRETQSQLKMLVLNQQAVCVHYSQHLLRLTHAQAEVAMRRHKECQRRHKQLRIVRRESARVCHELEVEQSSRREAHQPLNKPRASLNTLPPPPAKGGAAAARQLTVPSPRSRVPAASHRRPRPSMADGKPYAAPITSSPGATTVAPPEGPPLQNLVTTIATSGETGEEAYDDGDVCSAAAAAAAAQLVGVVQSGEAKAMPQANIVRLVQRACNRASRRMDAASAAAAAAATASGRKDKEKAISKNKSPDAAARTMAALHADVGRQALRLPAVQAALAEAIMALSQGAQQSVD